MNFTRAIVRVPSPNFAEGITTSGLPPPDYSLALKQHEAYVRALEDLGLTVVVMPGDERFPDSTFVEDTAIVTGRGAILTKPGAPSRVGEIEGIKATLAEFYSDIRSIVSPGTVDGGDVCQAGDLFYIGLSTRTNEAGSEQLAGIVREFGYTSTIIDIRHLSGRTPLLHLKSGLAHLGDMRLALTIDLAEHHEFRDHEIVRVPDAEEYAANCLAINGTILIASGYPKFESQIRDLGYRTVAIDMSEFQKMDGGLSCLSLRF